MGSNDARWRASLGRQYPKFVEPPPGHFRDYSSYESRSGVFPFERLARAFQNAVAYPPLRVLGTKPDTGGRVGHWIPEFEFRLLHSLSARSRAVYNLYILQKKSARSICDHYGWGFLSQHDVYILAGRIKKVIAAHYDGRTDYDWELAWMLAEEGASDEEITEIIKCKPQTFRKKQLATGRSKSKLKVLSPATVDRIRERLALGHTNSVIAHDMGLHITTVLNIKNGKTHAAS